MNSYRGIRHLPWDKFMVYGVNRPLGHMHFPDIFRCILRVYMWSLCGIATKLLGSHMVLCNHLNPTTPCKNLLLWLMGISSQLNLTRPLCVLWCWSESRLHKKNAQATNISSQNLHDNISLQICYGIWIYQAKSGWTKVKESIVDQVH